MKDLYIATDLLTLLRQDAHYSVQKNLANALRKSRLPYNEHADNFEQMVRTLTFHLLDQGGETEPFLTESFIYTEVLIKQFKDHGLPTPAALQPTAATQSDTGPLDPAQFEQTFALICRNCGTVTDPLGTTYQTPIMRLIFRTYLEILRNQGVKTTAWYVLEHLKDFDTEKVITAVEDDYVTWRTEDAKEKLTSLHTIGKFILKLDREVEKILG